VASAPGTEVVYVDGGSGTGSGEDEDDDDERGRRTTDAPNNQQECSRADERSNETNGHVNHPGAAKVAQNLSVARDEKASHQIRTRKRRIKVSVPREEKQRVTLSMGIDPVEAQARHVYSSTRPPGVEPGASSSGRAASRRNRRTRRQAGRSTAAAIDAELQALGLFK